MDDHKLPVRKEFVRNALRILDSEGVERGSRHRLKRRQYNIPNKLLKDFAHELAPAIQDIYNQSLKDGFIPSLLKSSIITPIPKVTPPQ